MQSAKYQLLSKPGRRGGGGGHLSLTNVYWRTIAGSIAVTIY